MNKYQKIIRRGEELQPGSIDTHAKFAQLTKGVDFKDKIVTDIGCNLGEMCRLAMRRGAKQAIGIDRTIEYLHDARLLNPKINFIVGNDDKINGNNDIVIASAMFHYVKDHDAFFKQIAKCTKLLVMDVWLANETPNLFQLSHRGLYIPTRIAFEDIVYKYFNKIELKENSISPDSSKRYIFHISEPKKLPSKALILYGPSNVGKTTMAHEHEALGYHYLSTDLIFMSFYKAKHKDISIPYSVRGFVDKISDETRKDYHKFHMNYIKKWLLDKIGHDIVIEGYDISDSQYRCKLKRLLTEWELNEINLKKVWTK